MATSAMGCCYHTVMADLPKALHSGRVLLMDGAMGTELLRRGVQATQCFESLNLTQPPLLRTIHRDYVNAGAEVLLTNTFQANPARLGKFGLEGEFYSVGKAGIDLARESAGSERFVLFDAGPLEDAWRRNAVGCIVQLATHERVDGVLMETCSTIDDAARLVKQKRRSDVKHHSSPVLMSWTFQRMSDGIPRTRTGDSPEACAFASAKLPVAALGVNCGRDIRLDDVLQIVQRYRAVTDLPLFVRPNAGTPKQIDGQWVYPETPESMAAWLPELFKAGVVMVGGCCGTTPAHIAAFRKVVDEWNASPSPPTPLPLSDGERGSSESNP